MEKVLKYAEKASQLPGFESLFLHELGCIYENDGAKERAKDIYRKNYEKNESIDSLIALAKLVKF